MLRNTLGLIACAAVASAVLVLAGPASAGTYTVYSCGGPAGGNQNLFHGWADNGNLAAYLASCPANTAAPSWNTGLVARTAWQNGSVSWLQGAYLAMDAPGGAVIGRIRGNYNVGQIGYGTQYWSMGIVGYGTDTDRSINTNAANVQQFCWANGAGCGGNNGWFDVAVSKPSVRLEDRCAVMSGCPTHVNSNSPDSWIDMWNVSVDVYDSTLPSISSVGGGLASGSWERGTQSITWNSSDNVGIHDAQLYVDGGQATNWTNSCDYTQIVPCGNLNGGSFSYNTDSLSDGAHTVTLYVSDSAGNRSSYSNTIYVDHTAPSAPSISTSGNWQNSNSFQATVANAGGQYAPITAIYYQVCDSQGGNCGAVKSATPSSGASNGQTTLSGLTLPADGDYTVRSYEQDSVGNVSAANLSNAASAHLRLDRVAPTAPTALAVDGNGAWQSTNSFRISWTNPSGQLAPITKAYAVECDTSNVCVTSSQSAADINQASGVTVPRIGDYSTTVYLQDAAGNTAPANASSAVHLRFDNTVPGQAQPSIANGWLNADQAKGYDQPITYPQTQPNLPSGVAGYSVTTDGTDPDATIDVTTSGQGPKNDWPVTATLTNLPEGNDTVKARAISGSGVAGATFGVTTLKVDKTAPTASVDGTPDPGRWQTSAVKFTINAADALSGMTASSTSDVTKGGYVSYRVDDGEPVNVAGPTTPVVVGADGVHTVYYRAYDVAGNPSPEQSIKVRIDVTAPVGSFEGRDANDPRKFVADVEDAASGVAGGTIQIRLKRGDWQSIPTTYDGAGHLVATVDDTQIPQGTYAMQALVTDNAGNQGVVDTRADGSPMQVAFPLRGPVTLSASTQTVATTSCRTVKITRLRKGKKVHKRLRVCKATRLPSKKRGKKIVVRPKVTKTSYVFVHMKDAAGTPIKDAAVTIAEQPKTGGGFADEAHLATDANGDLRYTIAKTGPSRTIRSSFDGTDTLLPSSADVQVLVPASTTLKASRKSLRPGGRIVFRGQLAGGYVPKAGKLVNLQVFFRHKWRTFATPRAPGSGAWKFTYRFTARYSRPLSYRFRALVPVEQAYPFEAGGSRVVKVVVHP